MIKSNRLHVTAAMFGIAATAVIAAPAIGSPPSGITPTTYATADLDAGDHLNDDRIKFQTKAPTDVRMQLLSFGPNSTTGWHHHPGMVIVVVASGTIELWNSGCGKKAYGPGSPNGQVFVEAGDHAHQATSADGATVYVTYVAPSASPPVFRVEEQVPFCAQ